MVVREVWKRSLAVLSGNRGERREHHAQKANGIRPMEWILLNRLYYISGQD